MMDGVSSVCACSPWQHCAQHTEVVKFTLFFFGWGWGWGESVCIAAPALRSARSAPLAVRCSSLSHA